MKRMLQKGRKDFGNYLAEILDITPGAASRKLNKETKFSLDDVKKIALELNLSIDEIDSIFIGEIE